MARILVTGGAGFIGSHLCERLLDDGNSVLCLDDLSNSSFENIRHLYSRKGFLFLKRDVRDDLVQLKPDVIFHLAAQISVDKSVYEPQDTISRNINGTLNALEAARICGSRVVMASSSEVYGTAEYAPQDEKHPLNPTSPYAVSKLAADRMCMAYQKIFDMPITVLRCFNIYGPRQSHTSYGGVIAKFVDRVLNSKPPIIYGDGSQTRDYTHVSDAVEAYMLAMKSQYYGVLNIGTGKEISIKELADMVIGECISTHPRQLDDVELGPVYAEPRPNDVLRLCCDSILARKVLKWKPNVEFKDGLHDYIRWFSNMGGNNG